MSDAGTAAPSSPANLAADSTTGGVYSHRYALYYSFFFASYGDRMWEFASVIYIMLLFPTTLLYASLFGLFELLAGIIAGPYIGRAIDSPTTSRLTCVRVSIVGQNGAICAASALLFLMMRSVSELSSFQLYAGYALLVAASMVAKAASSLNKVAIHKDWVMVLTEGRSERLSSLNGAMRGIDLSSSIVAPLMVGLSEAFISKEAAVVLIGVWSAISCFIELALIQRVWREIPQLHVKRPGKAAVEALSAHETGQRPQEETLGSQLLADGVGSEGAVEVEEAPQQPRSSWAAVSLYAEHVVFLPSVAYCMLYVSLLSFGGLMTAYLSSSAVELSAALLAVGRGLAALVGLLATLTVPLLIGRLGLGPSGHLAMLSQSLFLCVVVFSFYIGLKTQLGLVLLFVGLCASRYGLWAFDLVETQILQEGVAGLDVGAVNGVQESFMNLCWAASFVLTVVWADPQAILYPVWLSFLSVLAATLVFSYWAVGTTGKEWERARQRKVEAEMRTVRAEEAESVVEDGKAVGG